MDKLRRLAKPVAHLVVLGLLATTLPAPAARAAMIGTDAVVANAQAQPDRDRLRAALNREEVRARLLALGTDPSAVQARVDGLTDREAQLLAQKMDQLPAGGDAIGWLVFVFLVLLITDIMGLTDVFPFVKKHERKR